MPKLSEGVRLHDDGVKRCHWCGDDPLYQRYHDDEWGVPATYDRRLFEKICLEGFQSGLSWLVVLRKRDQFRNVFHDFDWQRVARFTQKDVARLLDDPGIIRHRGKIESTVNNARCMQEHFDAPGALASFVWAFEPPADDTPRTSQQLRENTTHPESTRLSTELKKRGFSFVGPTTCYAFMQALGLVDDHIAGCDAELRCRKARKALRRPV
ncbi:MAG: DNA-3-methyladenine glycosylase I [Clostridia bacterium]|nr:DNA-3-methyladenine glycosylase I [Deltaproteobacteria bacterium]